MNRVFDEHGRIRWVGGKPTTPLDLKLLLEEEDPGELSEPSASPPQGKPSSSSAGVLIVGALVLLTFFCLGRRNV